MIQHYWVKENTTLERLATKLSLDSQLISFGSIYLNGHRCLTDKTLSYGDYLRIVTNPKRYLLPPTIPIVFQNQDFVVVDKPIGIPVPATVDNFCENLRYLTEKQLQTSLSVTHRLDTETSGLTVLAKTKTFLSFFHSLLRQKAIQKKYTALTSEKVELGILRHYMHRSSRTPKKVTDYEFEGGMLCELEILSSSRNENFYENQIRLITGRTHQIRAQLSQLQQPIIGDTPYGGNPFPRLCLHASELTFSGFHFTSPAIFG